jgi:predicted MFS family arabinose efflux permease
LFVRDGYRTAFGVLLLPALLALGVLVLARTRYPHPRDFEVGTPPLATRGFPRVFWLYLGAVGLIAAGYVDFPLIAYHAQQTSLASEEWIPVLYAVAMGVDALAALVAGWLFDRLGFAVLSGVALVSALFAPLVFLGNFGVAMLGMGLWGIGMGAQESIMRAAVAGMVPAAQRGTAYGVFNTGYGLLWFAGSALMGVLYDLALPMLIAFSVVVQLMAVVMLFLVSRRHKA